MSSGRVQSERRGDVRQTTGTSGRSVVDADRSSGEESTQKDLSKDEIFDVLRNGRRRAAIVHLRRHDGEMSVSDVATCVAADEYDVAPENLSADQYKRVYTGLYQCHFPRVEALGIVEFDTDENTVRLTPRASALDPFLDDGETADRPWIKLGVAIATALLVALGWAGMNLFGIGSPTVLTGPPVGALLVMALLQS